MFYNRYAHMLNAGLHCGVRGTVSDLGGVHRLVKTILTYPERWEGYHGPHPPLESITL